MIYNLSIVKPLDLYFLTLKIPIFIFITLIFVILFALVFFSSPSPLRRALTYFFPQKVKIFPEFYGIPFYTLKHHIDQGSALGKTAFIWSLGQL